MSVQNINYGIKKILIDSLYVLADASSVYRDTFQWSQSCILLGNCHNMYQPKHKLDHSPFSPDASI
jgi:hypothetical protein